MHELQAKIDELQELYDGKVCFWKLNYMAGGKGGRGRGTWGDGGVGLILDSINTRLNQSLCIPYTMQPTSPSEPPGISLEEAEQLEQQIGELKEQVGSLKHSLAVKEDECNELGNYKTAYILTEHRLVYHYFNSI